MAWKITLCENSVDDTIDRPSSKQAWRTASHVLGKSINNNAHGKATLGNILAGSKRLHRQGRLCAGSRSDSYVKMPPHPLTFMNMLFFSGTTNGSVQKKRPNSCSHRIAIKVRFRIVLLRRQVASTWNGQFGQNMIVVIFLR